MKCIKIYRIVLAMYIIHQGTVAGQTANTTAEVLTSYIRMGLDNNLALKGKQFDLERSRLALREARSYYLPSITLLGDYSAATGGRKIQLPLGDLLNPVYGSLNQLTASNDFSMIANQEVAFLQPRLQDSRIQLTVPLLNGEIKHQNGIQKEAVTAKQAELSAFKRELIRDIRVAYYTCQQAEKLVLIYKNAESLIKENLRVTDVLLKNNIGIKSNILSVRTELLKNTSHLIEAENKRKAAIAYLNFLLNRPLDEVVTVNTEASTVINELDFPEHTSYTKRDELVQLNSMIRESMLFIKKERSTGMPQLGAFLNSGIQGSSFHSNNSNGYLVGGIQLKWTLFNGSRTSIKVQQAVNSLQMMQTKLSEATTMFQVENITKDLELRTAVAKVNGSASSLELSKELYRETQLRYRQGQALAIELLDAFTHLLNDQISLEIDQTNVKIKQAELERSTAAYNL
ncbi:MAG: TolC family protein [Sphingobacteriaceae bacterium]|nr:TolC family protein [Sphingobacteriaceae bacterium]